MPDFADLARDAEEHHREVSLANRKPYTLPAGKAGDCDLCGEWSSRLVVSVCAPCRDRYKIEERRNV